MRYFLALGITALMLCSCTTTPKAGTTSSLAATNRNYVGQCGQKGTPQTVLTLTDELVEPATSPGTSENPYQQIVTVALGTVVEVSATFGTGSKTGQPTQIHGDSLQIQCQQQLSDSATTYFLAVRRGTATVHSQSVPPYANDEILESQASITVE
jgi:hypothetical protein